MYYKYKYILILHMYKLKQMKIKKKIQMHNLHWSEKKYQILITVWGACLTIFFSQNFNLLASRNNGRSIGAIIIILLTTVFWLQWFLLHGLHCNFGDHNTYVTCCYILNRKLNPTYILYLNIIYFTVSYVN